MEKELIKKIVVGTSLGFLLGFGSAWMYLDNDSSKVAGDEISKNDAEEVDENNAASAPIVVSSQDAGDKVIISSANLDAEAWVVIYEENEGELGRILGARLFPKGETKDREVFLLRATVPNQRYFALLHSESGDGEFDYKQDIAMTENGSDRLMLTSFEVK